ncbi:class I SAM-dependent methyltransferase [Streptomyces rapamycinicus]|uniref:Methyltransferase n=2 Tax=Streptomyces rapamycinicus TaxID=1226757 RepID=A0A3L8RC77_STRRN|nr:methyltransferase domain-containing protein [Streptomyces rapamycinicus]MBB4789350.1 demethylmenaquinone methyltransferase/2-methoxy-6-polyprenyl-1,4-benzoquinol methylase [Streptomyces rapamycinicus]RLV77296.1 methyltransferase [Streptomyces rapamycinicus NRRL 5491]UTO67223.1 methyltransferase domain-containing protein [Streptomyces rapamycinicus]UTP35181.1 methyltransferase domain-containing protein [Streptomyces rapamycinicus NRRL 5491]
MLELGNRLKFRFTGPLLEAVNPRLQGHPYDVLMRLLEGGRIENVLELCGGTGFASRMLAERHSKVQATSIDLSPELTAVGRRKLASRGIDNVTLVEGDVSTLPYPDDSFDTVMSAFGLHEVPTAGRLSAIRESVRVLKPGGRFVIVDLDRRTKYGWTMDLFMKVMEPKFAPEVFGTGLVDRLKENGFTIDHHESAGPNGWTQSIVATLEA